MLTLAEVSAAQAEHYYEKDNYYSQEQGVESSEWLGKGAVALGLQGKVAPEDFKAALDGYAPAQRFRLSGRSPQAQHRAAIDQCFEAPKSVSLLALWKGDEAVVKAHQSAVKSAFAITEQLCGQARVWDGRQQLKVKTGNLVAASFLHTVSREKDPHLHTHVVTINATQLPDGRWRALSNEELFNTKKLRDQLYCNVLATQLQQLGYELEFRPDGLFEVKGYSREQLEWFSKRHQQIIQYAGVGATTLQKVQAWEATRRIKGKVETLDTLRQAWDAENVAFGVGVIHPEPHSGDQAQVVDLVLEAEPVEAVLAQAIAHCAERNVAFKDTDLLRFAFERLRGFGYEEFTTAIATCEELVKLDDGRFTTDRAIRQEAATLSLMHQGQGVMPAIAPGAVVESQLSNHLTPGQRDAVLLAITSRDRVMAWQGVAGAGKTFTAQQFKDVAAAQGYIVRGFAPSAEAAKTLGDELGIAADTVARLLHSQPQASSTGQEIWLVDEAGLLSTRAALELLQRATDANARVLLIGDTRQLSAVEAGNPFKALQQAGMTTAHLNQSIRQQAAQAELRQGIHDIAQGRIREGFDRIDRSGHLIEVADTPQRHQRIVQDYLALTPTERSKTLILAGTHKEREALTHLIRQGLKQEGQLSTTAIASRFVTKDLTEVQTLYTHSFNVGDVLVPLRQYPGQGLNRGQHYEVTAVARDTLTLQDGQGNCFEVNPLKFRKSVFSPAPIEIAVGDRLRFTQNDKAQHRRNGQEFTVVGIEDDQAQIQLKNGTIDHLDLKQPQHWDHAWVSTIYSSQGKTADRALVSTDPTIGQESFYVAVSRVKRELQLYTGDKQALLKSAQRSRAKENALELLRANAQAAAIAASPLSTSPSHEQQPTPSAPQFPRGIDGQRLGIRIAEQLDARGRAIGANRAAGQPPGAGDRPISGGDRHRDGEIERLLEHVAANFEWRNLQRTANRIATAVTGVEQCFTAINGHYQDLESVLATIAATVPAPAQSTPAPQPVQPGFQQLTLSLEPPPDEPPLPQRIYRLDGDGIGNRIAAQLDAHRHAIVGDAAAVARPGAGDRPIAEPSESTAAAIRAIDFHPPTLTPTLDHVGATATYANRNPGSYSANESIAGTDESMAGAMEPDVNPVLDAILECAQECPAPAVARRLNGIAESIERISRTTSIQSHPLVLNTWNDMVIAIQNRDDRLLQVARNRQQGMQLIKQQLLKIRTPTEWHTFTAQIRPVTKALYNSVFDALPEQQQQYLNSLEITPWNTWKDVERTIGGRDFSVPQDYRRLFWGLLAERLEEITQVEDFVDIMLSRHVHPLDVHYAWQQLTHPHKARLNALNETFRSILLRPDWNTWQDMQQAVTKDPPYLHVQLRMRREPVLKLLQDRLERLDNYAAYEEIQQLTAIPQQWKQQAWQKLHPNRQQQIQALIEQHQQSLKALPEAPPEPQREIVNSPSHRNLAQALANPNPQATREQQQSEIDPVQHERGVEIGDVALQLLKFLRQRDWLKYPAPHLWTYENGNHSLTYNHNTQQLSVFAKDGRGELFRGDHSSGDGKIVTAQNITEQDMQAFGELTHRMQVVIGREQVAEQQRQRSHERSRSRSRSRESDRGGIEL